MSKVSLEDIFMDIMNEVKEFIPEADHLEMYEQVIQKLADDGYDLNVLYGFDDIVDQALDHICDEYDNEDEYFG